MAAILALHGGLMVMKLKGNISVTTFSEAQPIQIKFLPEIIKATAPSSIQSRQIVQSEDSESLAKPKEAFLSDKDRSFERETMARTIESFNKAALGNSSQTQKAAAEKSPTQKKAIKDLKLSDFGMGPESPQMDQVTRTPAKDSTQGLKNGDSLSKGLSATNDYVEDVRLGDFTQLNTVEYKHYGFFFRIRQKLEQFWGNSIQEKTSALFRSGRRLPASENLVTSLQVTLNVKGEIVAVKILGASGVKELDDAAIESFNQAGPFPNPPQDLLVNGKAVIEFGFVVKS